MRHAKSSWDTPNLKDFDRPLNNRGERDAPKMGAYLNGLQLIPDYIFCSPAKRTRSTLSHITNQITILQKDIEFAENLYFKGLKAYIHTLKNTRKSISTVMVIGHNPMTEDAQQYLAKNPVSKPFKTATIACLEANISDWEKLDKDCCTLKWMIGPKDLP